MLITIIAASGGTADVTFPSAGASFPAGIAGHRHRQRIPKPAAIRRMRSRTPWNIPSSTS